MLTRRKFLWAAGAAGALVLGADAFGLEPLYPRLVRIEIALQRLPEAFDGFTIAQLSDFHYDEHFGLHPIRAAVQMVNEIRPDLAVLTGDFVTASLFIQRLSNGKESAKAAEPCAQLLAGLRTRLGRLAVLGNHDVGTDPGFVIEALQSHDIRTLRNTSYVIEQNGARLWFAGLDSTDRRPSMDAALHGLPPGEAVVLMIHEPDFADIAKKYPVDLQLSGHSHGGQVWLPGIGAPWLPTGARKYPRGRYQVGPLPLYTNIGLGTIRLPVRVNCPPEVTLITLRAGNGNKKAA